MCIFKSEMKIIKLLFFILIIVSCKEKTFADDIVLTTDSKIEMKFQEFNEGVDENTSPLIYVGKIKDTIPLKYYFLYPKPPQIYSSKTTKEINDSIAKETFQNRFFHGDYVDEFKRVVFSNENVKFDSLSKDNLQIIVKNKDTIPKFFLDSMSQLKAYKAFPVFIKNISGKKLKMVVDQFPGIVVLNKENKWQIIKNDSFYVCGNSGFKPGYWILEPDEIAVYAINHFQGKQKARFKIGLTQTFLSEEFEGNINPKIIRNQRDEWIIK